MRKLAVLLCLALAALSLTPVAAPGATKRTATLDWKRCSPQAGPPFECATARVPLDYSVPNGPRISLALIRLPASDPGAKLGTIFLNPGGPGGSGVDFVRQIGPVLFNDEVRAHFDLVGFDPRGIMRSSPLICFRSFEESLQVFPPFAFPTSPDEEALVERLDKGLNAACQRRGGDIIDHMATADVARDLDFLREAVGDSQLNYVGYSYGSFLGVTYANLFRDRVGAVVVDGVLDPIAWTTGVGDQAVTLPFSTRLRSDAGAQATLDEFFRLCDEAGPAGCAFAGDAGERFAALAEQLKSAPIEIMDPETGETFQFRYSDLIGESLGAMYNSASWPFFAEFLVQIEAAAGSQSLGMALQAVHEQTGIGGRRQRAVRYPNFAEGFPGVACSDSINPDDHSFWSRAGVEAEEEFGYFGRIWTWATSPCAVWEGFDAARYLGPFDNETSNPVLVVGTLFDPATRYEGAQMVDALLPNSSLLTVEGWGHTSIFLSACADQVTSQYLLDGATPPDGTTCEQDIGPFEMVTVNRSAGQLAERRAARADVMSEIAFFPRR